MEAFDFRPATITVSGYPALQAVAGLFDGHLIATAVHTHEIVNLHARQEAATTSDAVQRPARCGYKRCRRWTLRATLGGSELGRADLCPACRRTFTALCETRHGRLPVPPEFFCLTCQQIRPDTDRLRPDRRGQRYGCRPCRRRQVRGAVARFRR